MLSRLLFLHKEAYVISQHCLSFLALQGARSCSGLLSEGFQSCFGSMNLCTMSSVQWTTSKAMLHNFVGCKLQHPEFGAAFCVV